MRTYVYEGPHQEPHRLQNDNPNISDTSRGVLSHIQGFRISIDQLTTDKVDLIPFISSATKKSRLIRADDSYKQGPVSLAYHIRSKNEDPGHVAVLSEYDNKDFIVQFVRSKTIAPQSLVFITDRKAKSRKTNKFSEFEKQLQEDGLIKPISVYDMRLKSKPKKAVFSANSENAPVPTEAVGRSTSIQGIRKFFSNLRFANPFKKENVPKLT